MIRCFVVDDEPLARANIEALLQHEDEFEVVGSIGDAAHALDRVVTETPNLLFLDIRMPELDGLSFLREMSELVPVAKRPYAILVTAFDRYALQAFDYEAIDYLVKPVDTDRFGIAIRRARHRIELCRLGSVNRSTVQAGGESRICFKVSRGEIYLMSNQICWIETCDHYLIIHTPSREHLVRMNMSDAERMLADQGFLRVHRGALVNPRHISSHESQVDGGRLITLSDGSQVPVSRRRWPSVREQLN